MVTVGFAAGFWQVAQLSPVLGLHAYVVPPEPESAADVPVQMEAGNAEATAVIGETTVTVSEAVLVHPLPSVTVTV